MKQIEVKSPLCAISLSPIGYIMTVGTIKGKILVYDLKHKTHKGVMIELKG